MYLGPVNLVFYFYMIEYSEVSKEQQEQPVKHKEGKREYLELFHNLTIGCVRYQLIQDADGKPVDYRYMEMNPAYEKLSGLKSENCVGRPASEFGVIYDDNLLCLFADVAIQQCEKQFDYFSKQLDSWYRIVAYSPCKGEFVVLFNDVSEYYKVHDLVLRNERKFQTIFENLPVGIALYDEKGYFFHANERLLEIFGYVNKYQLDLSPLFDESKLGKEKFAILQDKGIITLDFVYDKAAHRRVDDKNLKNENLLYLQGKLISLPDVEAKNGGFILIILDNTELTRTGMELQENLARLSLILESGSVYPWYLDIQTGTIEIGDEFFEAYGVVRENSGNALYDVTALMKDIHPEDLKRFLVAYQLVLAGRENKIHMDLRVDILNNGSYVWLELNGMVQKKDSRNEALNMLGFVTDIGVRKDAEQQLIAAKRKAEESDELKSAFLANVSHEIRTPLNAIVGFSEIIAATDDKEEQDEYLDIVKANNSLLLHLVDGLLDLSKIESGKIEIAEEVVNIDELCRELQQIFQLRVKNGVEIRFEKNEEPLFILSDRNKLHQVYSNLLGNAVKNTLAGAITLGYKMKQGCIGFYVQDTGIGIPEEKLSSVFRRFVKINDNVQGFGLGLAICKSIVEKMNGRMEVESEFGHGSVFRFIIPYRKPDI